MKQVTVNNVYPVRSVTTMVEIHDCINCGRKINTEEDAFHIIDDLTYECWNCVAYPPGR
jgi:hypothetical protein